MSNEPVLKLEITAEDIPWMIHALSIQYTTSMMCGATKQTKARIKEKLDYARNFVPVLSGHDIEEYDFCEAVVALRKGKRWSIHQANKPVVYTYSDGTTHSYSRGSSYEEIILTVDDKRFKITRWMEYNEKMIADLKEFFETIVSLDAEYYEQPEKA